jgi:mRNA interferase RelE/StbE
MSYKYALEFHPKALEEWRSLQKPVREQLKKKLEERLNAPEVPAARIHGGNDLYKIKLLSAGIRLVYQIQNDRLIVLVLSVGKRERNAAYKAALDRA